MLRLGEMLACLADTHGEERSVAQCVDHLRQARHRRRSSRELIRAPRRMLPAAQRRWLALLPGPRQD